MKNLLNKRDDYLIPILSTEIFTFKSQLTSLYMHPTDYTFKLHDKNQDFYCFENNDTIPLLT